MPRIHALSETVSSQIAAGEVIERPASIIRELLDNAIDSGATNISVRLSFEGDEGGETSLEVLDDGSGIHPEDLPLAFAKHATSKIKALEDLYHTHTLGFRGEALASIASIAEVECVSADNADGEGEKLVIEGGKILRRGKASSPRGTRIRVSRIFFNTPVRKKFLKSPLSEKNEVKREIMFRALAHTGIGFSLGVRQRKESEREEIRVPGNFPFRDRILYFFGRELEKHLIEITSSDKETVRVSGFITSHRHHVRTRKDQYFFVKGRAVQNPTLSAALYQAYVNVLPSKTHPACFLEVSLPDTDVDVNVHPQKKDLRFREPDLVYRVVHQKVKEALYTAIQGSQKNDIEVSYKLGVTKKNEEIRLDDFGQKIFESPASSEAPVSFLEKSFFSRPSQGEAPGESKETIADSNSPGPAADTYSSPKETEILSSGEIPGLRILGQIGELYIAYTLGPDLYLADQHAVHERMNFDELVEKIEKGGIAEQPLLAPLLIQRPRTEMGILLEKRDALAALGLEFEPFGEETIRFDALPSYIPERRESSVVNGFLDLILENKNLSRRDLTEKMISTAACRMSVMSGDRLTGAQMLHLIEALYRKNYVHLCPHGRPFVKKISFEELHRFFGRTGVFHEGES
ncbi:MAG: DNA mismatch repair endonuclease MutL [Spirochaetia bacterium]|nr:DNA mismatch repair endonuclease MutL [Spirochaetia bacterium]